MRIYDKSAIFVDWIAQKSIRVSRFWGIYGCFICYWGARIAGGRFFAAVAIENHQPRAAYEKTRYMIWSLRYVWNAS